jgi:hypothetical protein
MSSLATLLVTFACTVGGVVVGMVLRPLLPQHHLREDSKDAIKLGAGVIATLAALVLGLMVGSAKSSFDAVNSLVVQTGAKIMMADRVLAQYGPEAQEIRERMRSDLAAMTAKVWGGSGDTVSGLKAVEASTRGEDLLGMIRALKPGSDAQSALQAQALQIGNDLQQSRWLLVEQSQTELPGAFLAVLLCWLTILYTAYGLLTPANATVVLVLLVCALSMSGAIFLIVEMNQPFDGTIKVSRGPIDRALQHIGQ